MSGGAWRNPDAHRAYKREWKRKYGERRHFSSETEREEWLKHKRARDRAWYGRNKEKVQARMKAWRDTPERKQEASARTSEWHKRNPRKWRNTMLQRKFGITLEQYEEILNAQGRVCVICKQAHLKRQVELMPVDHDHSTGKIRAILCQSCNRGIGLLQEDPDVLMEAARYLLKHGVRPLAWRSITELA